MRTDNDTSTPSRRSHHLGRKGKALLAGGLVLGVGAAITLATWNSSQYATGSFTAGSQSLESSVDGGTTWADHSASNAATLSFTDAAADLSSGDTTYASYALRLGAGTTDDATVTVSNPVASTGEGDSVAGLTYTLVQTTGTTCDADAVAGGTALVPSGTSISTGLTTLPTFGLTKPATADTAGTAVNLCLAVTAGTGFVQGQTGSATWQFTAVSE